jgi:hypothetical protein
MTAKAESMDRDVQRVPYVIHAVHPKSASLPFLDRCLYWVKPLKDRGRGDGFERLWERRRFWKTVVALAAQSSPSWKTSFSVASEGRSPRLLFARAALHVWDDCGGAALRYLAKSTCTCHSAETAEQGGEDRTEKTPGRWVAQGWRSARGDRVGADLGWMVGLL